MVAPPRPRSSLRSDGDIYPAGGADDIDEEIEREYL